MNFSAIFAATNSTTDWAASVDGNVGDPNNGASGVQSNLYPGLTDGMNAVAAGAGAAPDAEFDNARYVGITSGTAVQLRLAISDVANWEGTNASQSVSNGGPGSAIWAANTATQFTVVTPTFLEFCFGDGGDQLGCTDCPCFNNAPMGSGGGCLNSSGTGSQLLVSGDPSVSLPVPFDDDLRFRATNGPAFQLFILNSGDALAPGNPLNPCFGTGSGVTGTVFDGLRCAIQNTLRNGGRGADSNGEVGVGLTSAGWGGGDDPLCGIAQSFGYVAGTTKFFQAIHRDSTAVNCGLGLNTTQAIQVDFTP